MKDGSASPLALWRVKISTMLSPSAEMILSSQPDTALLLTKEAKTEWLCPRAIKSHWCFAPFTEGYSHHNGKSVLCSSWHVMTGHLNVTDSGVQVL